jgi:hypothetical protein
MLKLLTRVAIIGLLSACSTSHPVVTQTPTPAIAEASATPDVTVSASPIAPPSPSPPSSPISYPTLPPPPIGTPVTRRALAPATVLPAVQLCSAPLQVFQDGNAGPLFCRSGALNVTAWAFFAQLKPRVFPLGPNATLAQIESAICAGGGQNMTLPEIDSSYALAASYYDWIHGVAHGFDDEAFIQSGGCH